MTLFAIYFIFIFAMRKVFRLIFHTMLSYSVTKLLLTLDILCSIGINKSALICSMLSVS